MNNIRTTFFLLTAVMFLSCSSIKNADQHQEKWISLFNGKDIKDWNVKIHHHDYKVNFGNTFRVDSGIIKVRYDHTVILMISLVTFTTKRLFPIIT